MKKDYFKNFTKEDIISKLILEYMIHSHSLNPVKSAMEKAENAYAKLIHTDLIDLERDAMKNIDHMSWSIEGFHTIVY